MHNHNRLAKLCRKKIKSESIMVIIGTSGPDSGQQQHGHKYNNTPLTMHRQANPKPNLAQQ